MQHCCSTTAFLHTVACRVINIEKAGCATLLLNKGNMGHKYMVGPTPRSMIGRLFNSVPSLEMRESRLCNTTS